MGLPISDKDYQIIRVSALKSAAQVAGAMAGPITSGEVLAYADQFEAWMLIPFAKPVAGQNSSGPVPSSTPSSPAPQPLPDPYSPPTSRPAAPPSQNPPRTGDRYGQTAELCPACLEQGRGGVVIAKLLPTDKGPAKKCSLSKRVKQNGEYVDVGQCSWQAWD